MTKGGGVKKSVLCRTILMDAPEAYTNSLYKHIGPSKHTVTVQQTVVLCDNSTDGERLGQQ